MAGVLSGLLLAGCSVGPGATPTGVPPVRITIVTAPGETLAYVPAQATVVTSGGVAVALENRSTLAHNLVFAAPLDAATRTIVEPGTGDQVLLAALPPGSYAFMCTIHAGMTGVLIAGNAAP